MRYLLLIFLILPLCGFGQIYKWTDENGNVHFGDSPKETDKAEQVVIEVNSYESVSYDDIEYYQQAESKRVTMYATSWCGYCSKARSYFNEKGIAYTEYDIEKDERAKKAYDSLGGRGVPVILVGKKRMNGFSAAGFERVYN